MEKDYSEIVNYDEPDVQQNFIIIRWTMSATEVRFSPLIRHASYQSTPDLDDIISSMPVKTYDSQI